MCSPPAVSAIAIPESAGLLQLLEGYYSVVTFPVLFFSGD